MRRLIAFFGVTFVVAGVVLGVADRVAAHYAEQEIAERVAIELASRNITSAPPDVTITGFPFLTQVAQGSYDEIQLDLRDLKGGTIPLPLLEVHAFDVKASVQGMQSGEKAVATRITGVGTMSYAELVAAAGLTGITLSGDGVNLRVTGEAPIAGRLTGAARVMVIDGQVRIEVTELTASNLTAAAQELVNNYAQRLQRTFSLPVLPFNMRLESVNPDPTGLRIGVSAREVEL